MKFAEGWIEFDPTPERTEISTTTEITYVDSKLIAYLKWVYLDKKL